MFVFECLIWNSFITGQLLLNAFTYCIETFLHITKNLVNWKFRTKVFPCVCNDLDIQKAEKDAQKKERKIMLVWGKNLRLRNFHIPEKEEVLNPIQVDFFGAAHRWEWEAKKAPLSKTCHTNPTMMKLGTAIPYPRKI